MIEVFDHEDADDNELKTAKRTRIRRATTAKMAGSEGEEEEEGARCEFEKKSNQKRKREEKEEKDGHA
jgi:hypothetical protein